MSSISFYTVEKWIYENNQEECSLCFDPLFSGNEIVVGHNAKKTSEELQTYLAQGEGDLIEVIHSVHQRCLSDWFNKEKSCPTCKGVADRDVQVLSNANSRVQSNEDSESVSSSDDEDDDDLYKARLLSKNEKYLAPLRDLLKGDALQEAQKGIVRGAIDAINAELQRNNVEHGERKAVIQAIFDSTLSDISDGH